MAWKVYLQEFARFGSVGFKMYVGRESHDGSMDVLCSPMIHRVEPASMLDEKDVFLYDISGFGENVRQFLQAMSDAAWEIGIKPKQIEDNSNELKATKFHLEDMRSLAGVKK